MLDRTTPTTIAPSATPAPAAICSPAATAMMAAAAPCADVIGATTPTFPNRSEL